MLPLSADYTVPIKTCIACSEKHDEAVIVVRDARVWYRCPKTHSLCYVKDARKA